MLALTTRTHLWRAVMLAVWLLPALQPVSAQAEFRADVEGAVTDRVTGLPISGAHVRTADLNLSANTDVRGRFVWRDIPLPQAMLPITLTISAAGFGDWTIQNVRLYAADTLYLAADLGPAPTVINVPPPRAEAGGGPALASLAALPTDDQMALPLPSTIRVRVAGYPYHCDLSRPYTVETLDFRYYLQHVLPNEWGASWHRESLRAGAMAAKMYAWYYLARGGKWPDADVYDSTCDQVYNPAIGYASTNAAVDDTLNWRLTRNNLMFPAFYRAYYWQCEDAGLAGNCMGQWDSKWMADAGSTWDEILDTFYLGSFLSPIKPPLGSNFALHFYGNGVDNLDRLRIQVDDPTNSNPGPPVDVGASDFTIEWWLKASAAEDPAPPVTCGANLNWGQGNVALDRSRYLQDRQFGVALAGGRVVFGVSGAGTGDLTLCGVTPVADGAWHHIAVARRRADGYLWLWVDGRLEASADGPDGNISYPDNGTPVGSCNGTCAMNEPYLVLGAEKRDTGLSFNGWLDEMRFSDVVRYPPLFAPDDRFMSDAHTVALYHFDDTTALGPCQGWVADSSGAVGGPSNGGCNYGGSPGGPQWEVSDVPPSDFKLYLFLPVLIH